MLPKPDPVQRTENKLGVMMMQQLTLQRDTYGIDYASMTDEELIHQFKEMKLALEKELGEALDEMGWKPWATSKHFNKPAIQGELVDAWHFFMNLMLIAGMTPDSLWDGYQAKRLKNIRRQQEGYDGVTGKCPGCFRALDDPHVLCAPGKFNRDGNVIEVIRCKTHGLNYDVVTREQI